MLDLRPNWVVLWVNVYNKSSQFNVKVNHFSKVIVFIWFLNHFFLFVRQFYAHSSSLYFSQASWFGDFILILLESNIQQDDQLGRALFPLVHPCVSRLITTTHLICVFFLLVDDTHIINLTLNIIFSKYIHFDKSINMFLNIITTIVLDNGTYAEKEVSHLFFHHTQQ